MWQRLVDDPETARRCWEAIDDIERGLLPWLDGMPSPSLGGGTAGLAMFFAYLGAARQASPDTSDAGSDASDRALDILGGSIEAVGELQLPPSLYGGFTGIGWVVEHLTQAFFEADDDLTSEIDSALREWLAHPGVLEYELISGLAGFGSYLIERLPHPDAAELLVRIVDRLEAMAVESPDGLTWYTPPEWMPPWQREAFPEGYHNLGVAHGIPGIVGFLAAAWNAVIADPRIPVLAVGAVRWLLARRLPPEGDSSFSAMISPERKGEPTRTAWCYGDPGIAAVLLSAARSFDRPDWEREALATALRAARRPLEKVQAVDAGLCHGTAGLTSLYLRFYQTTGNPELKEAARFWLERTLELRRPGEGIGGYLALVPPMPGTKPQDTWEPEPGLLTGAAGVGLALLATVSEVDPGWDRVLLMSLPPRPAQESGLGG
jgi:lantibiotic modifying enzyme